MSCEQNYEFLPLGVQQVHCPESQLGHHILASTQSGIHQIQGVTNQSDDVEEGLRGALLRNHGDGKELTRIDQFIVGPFAQEHGLNDSETDKPLLDAKDFMKVLRCH